MQSSQKPTKQTSNIVKKAVTLCVFITLGFGAYAQVNTTSKRIDISLSNATLKDFFVAIEKSSDFRFLYDASDIDINKPISAAYKDTGIDRILKEKLTDISYEIKGNQIVVKSKPKVPQVRQQITITGTVTDIDGMPMPGVNVVVKGTIIGVVTNLDGKYSIVAPNENAILMFSFVGYVTNEYTIGNQTKVDVFLEEDSQQIEEVVVIGYGTVRKSDLTGAVASISSDKVTQVNAVSNLAQALQGQSAGVQANQRSGQPGEAVTIRIRGANSIGTSNDPLYVVDGMLLESLSAQLNPDDIQNIEILKDASATAIYGSRGANGVIMVTTKRGTEGKAKVSYNGYFGTQRLRKKLDLINAREFAILQNEVAANDGEALPWTLNEIDALGAGTDWQKEVYRPGNVQNHDVSVMGGNANTKYYTSFGYFNQDGIIRNSGFDRMSFRINVDQKINQKLDLSTSLSIQNSKFKKAVSNADGGGGIPFTTMVMPAIQGIYNDDGTYSRFTGVSWGETNPVGISKEVYNPNNALRIIGNAKLTYEIIDGLRLKLSAGLDQNNSRTDYYAPSTITIGQTNKGNGKASKNYANSLSFLNENLLSYNKMIEDHNFDFLVGITYQYDKTEYSNSGEAIGFISDLYQNNNIGAAEIKAQPSTGFSDYKLLSYLGRINYNYMSKYYVTLTGRYDGSSKFGADNKYAFFPSGALAWRVSQESFMQEIKAISNLKLRLSYGTSGNQAIKPYETMARLENRNLIFDGNNNTGFVLGSLENKSLKWETTRQFDIGFDLYLFNDRIQLVADYYQKKTIDLLLPVTLPPSSGFSSVIQNVGSIQNRGWELQLTTINLDKEFKWSSVLTLSNNRTKVLDLGNDAVGNPVTYLESGTGGNWFPIMVGQSMRQLYGQIVDGVYQSDAEAVENGEPTKRAGDYKFRNFDGQGNVDDSDKRILSRLEPKLTFGFNHSFSYKNFDFSVLLVGTYGNDVVNEFRKYNLTVNGRWTPTREAFDNRWQGPGTSNSIDKPSKNSSTAIRDYANSLWVENGSYLRVRDITLGYTFPAKTIRFIASLRIYVSGQNLLTWTKYSGYDPEAVWGANTEINGWDRGVYPSTKSFTGGLRITF